MGLTFASGLRSVLRQDPDIICVGEIRDGETAEIAMRAAMTGHLVITTIHTEDAISAIDRLRDMGVAPYLIAADCEALFPAAAEENLSELQNPDSAAEKRLRWQESRRTLENYTGREPDAISASIRDTGAESVCLR